MHDVHMKCEVEYGDVLSQAEVHNVRTEYEGMVMICLMCAWYSHEI